MTKDEYWESIERIYGWPINERMYQIMAGLAKEYNSGSLVLKQWEIFQSENHCKSVDRFKDWIKEQDLQIKKQEDQGSLFGPMPWEDRK